MPIAFQCSGCGATLRVPDTMAGRRGKCPKCGAVNSIPGGTSQLQTAPPAPKAARPPKEAPPPDDVDNGKEAPAEEARPRRQGAKKKNRTMLFVGLGCGALLLLTCMGTGVGVGLWWYLSSPIGEELAYMPSNCEYVAAVKLDQLVASGAFKQVENELPPQFKQAMATADAEKEIGLALADIDRLVIGGPLSGRDEPVVAVRTKKPVKAEDMTAKVKGKSFASSKEGSYTIYEAPGGRPAFCVVKKNLVLFGSGAALRVVLRRDKKPEMSANLSAAMKEMDFKQTVTMAFAPQNNTVTPPPPLGGRGGMPFPGAAMAGPPPGAEWGVLHAKVANDVSITVIVQCKSPADASKAKSDMDESMTKLRQAPPPLKDLAGAIDIKSSVSGKKVTATIDIKVAPVIKVVKDFAGQFMGGMGGK